MRRFGIPAIATCIISAILLGAIVTAVRSQSATPVTLGDYKALYICGTTGKSLCKVGAVGPGGGTIFFNDKENLYPTFNYLEVAPATWAGTQGVDPTSIWCSDTDTKIQTTLNSWSSRAVGLGPTTTAIMLKNCTSGAANLVADYNANASAKKHDWFLPTIGELMLISSNLQGLAGLIDSDYWSSSGYSDLGGWVQAMGHGYQGNATKDTTFHVRPVRMF